VTVRGSFGVGVELLKIDTDTDSDTDKSRSFIRDSNESQARMFGVGIGIEVLEADSDTDPDPDESRLLICFTKEVSGQESVKGTVNGPLIFCLHSK
jgi:hypothetical protein